VKILILSAYDIWQGAAKAAYRLHQGLQRQPGVESWMLVNKKFSTDPSVIGPQSPLDLVLSQTRARLDQFPLRFYPQRETEYFSPQWLPERLAQTVRHLNPDVINVHWTQAGFMRIETLAQFHKPIVMTLHDLWALTGGCHYSQGCEKYFSQCGACPQLGSSRERDLAYRNWRRKQESWQNLDLTLVPLSAWLRDQVEKSPLLSTYPRRLIPNGIDLETYAPIDKAEAKKILGLAPERPVILFGASGAKRKGFHHLRAALALLSQTPWRERAQLLIFGNQAPGEDEDLGFPTRYLGFLQDELSLRLAYASADVFVAPSEEDNLPNTVVESLACGTAVVAFRIGGLPDLVDSGENGYLAEPFSAEDLAQGIEEILTQGQASPQLSRQARRKAETCFNQSLQSRHYLELFASIHTNTQEKKI
jgi:glycosyltransferase involved in cell wall biosynthesis